VPTRASACAIIEASGTDRSTVLANANLYQILYDRFSAQLTAPCLDLGDGGQLSYARVDAWSAAMACALEDLGASPGDRVVVQANKSPAGVALYLACLRGGFILVPLNTAYTNRELDYFINDASPAVVVCNPGQEAGISALVAAGTQVVALGGGARDLVELAAASGRKPDVCQRRPDDLAAIVYTSGTTGRSKGAMLSHGNLASNALTLHELWGFVPGDVLLHALPIFHVHGLFIALNTAMLNGSHIIFLDKFTTEDVLAALPRATVLMGVPTFYTRLLDSASFGAAHFAHMRLFISGSAPLTEQTFAAFEARTGLRILERYGMTETGMITSNPLGGERVAGTVGFPLPGVAVRVCDERGKTLPEGEVGVIEVTGPNVFKGYWNMPEKTAEEFRSDGWFITGDLGQLNAQGRLSIVGRAKDLIISGGFNIYPKEIELVLDATDQIAESAVIGVPHPDMGEAVVAVCVAATPTPPAPAAVLEAISSELAAFKRPRAVLFVDELPRNAMGKVQKNQLRDSHGELFSPA
jgi:malonyl-CoA/methylmalonyl-CoA synthetase